MPYTIAPHGHKQDPVAGRGFLGQIYKLPPRLAHRAVQCIDSRQVDRVELGDLEFRVVHGLKGSDEQALSAIDNVAFISYGYPFYTLWDRRGHSPALAEQAETDWGLFMALAWPRHLFDSVFRIERVPHFSIFIRIY